MLGLALCVIAVVSKGYRLGRFIAYFDPDYKVIETVDTHHWVRAYVSSSTAIRDADVSTSARRRSRWEPEACWEWD